MKDEANFGMNKTGTQMSPILTKEMLANMDDFATPPLDTSADAADIRQIYIQESGPLGTVPLPGTIRGATNVGFQMLKGDEPGVLIDKLGERLAFERGGARLYDALLIKCEVLMPKMSLDILTKIRDEERLHFELLWQVMEKLGADPTAQTPCADASGVMSMGLMQVLTDPRTTLPQCVQAIQIAELADHDGWEMLIELTQNAGLEEEAEKFRMAKADEENHLAHIKEWLKELTLANHAVPVQ